MFPAFVAKKLSRREINASSDAKDSLEAERIKLTTMPWPPCPKRNPTGKGKGTWDVSTVIEKKDLLLMARRTGETIHVGRIAAMCYEKGAELQPGHPDRKFRARTCFLGDQVKDEWYQEAEMEGLGSAPPAMEDSRSLDARSVHPDYEQTISDAISAYLQEYMRSKYKTYVSVCEEYWEPEWRGKYHEPCCLLILCLYGHTDSGGFWELKSYGDLGDCGWLQVDNRRGVFWKTAPHGIAFLMVYVDDFKMSCHKKDTQSLWSPIRQKIRMEEPKRSDRFLGCYSRRFVAPLSGFKPVLQHKPILWPRKNDKDEKRTSPIPWAPRDPERLVVGFEYEMSTYFLDVVQRFCDISGIPRHSLKHAPTPFIDESKDPAGVEDTSDPAVARACVILASTGGGDAASVDLAGGGNVASVLGAAKRGKPPVHGSGFTTPTGELNRNAASVGMAALYGGRLVRFDLLRAIQRVAEKFHAWTPLETKKLRRLVEYINSSLDIRSYAFIGDPWDQLELQVFVDADWASDRSDLKSTSGGYLVLAGPNSYFPIGAYCCKQGCQSLSTPEAESVALAQVIKGLCVPLMDLWELILYKAPSVTGHAAGSSSDASPAKGWASIVPATAPSDGSRNAASTPKLQLVLYEDNEATQKIVKSGKFSKALGHVSRTHGLPLAWLHTAYSRGLMIIRDCHTKAMAADIFTKYFVDPLGWEHARTLLGLLPPVKCKYDNVTASGTVGGNAAANLPPRAEVGGETCNRQRPTHPGRKERATAKAKAKAAVARRVLPPVLENDDRLPCPACLEPGEYDPNWESGRCAECRLMGVPVGYAASHRDIVPSVPAVPDPHPEPIVRRPQRWMTYRDCICPADNAQDCWCDVGDDTLAVSRLPVPSSITLICCECSDEIFYTGYEPPCYCGDYQCDICRVRDDLYCNHCRPLVPGGPPQRPPADPALAATRLPVPCDSMIECCECHDDLRYVHPDGTGLPRCECGHYQCYVCHDYYTDRCSCDSCHIMPPLASRFATSILKKTVPAVNIGVSLSVKVVNLLWALTRVTTVLRFVLCFHFSLYVKRHRLLGGMDVLGDFTR